MALWNKQQRREFVDLTCKLLAMGHTMIQIHKALIAIAAKNNAHSPSYSNTARYVALAKREMGKALGKSKEEMVSQVWHSLWDLRADPKSDGPTKLGALRQVAQLMGLNAATKTEVAVSGKGMVPLTVIVQACEQAPSLDIIDGTAYPIPAITGPEQPQDLIVELSENAVDDAT